MRQGDVDQSLPWTAERDKKSPLRCLHTFTFTPEGGACLWSHYANDPKWSVFYLLSYTSVPMTGSNFGNFFNGALKDFEAKQASRIRVRVWEFPWVIFLRNVFYVNSDYGFKFWWLLQPDFKIHHFPNRNQIGSVEPNRNQIGSVEPNQNQIGSVGKYVEVRGSIRTSVGRNTEVT